jgi:hypothetical protein
MRNATVRTPVGGSLTRIEFAREALMSNPRRTHNKNLQASSCNFIKIKGTGTGTHFKESETSNLKNINFFRGSILDN